MSQVRKSGSGRGSMQSGSARGSMQSGSARGSITSSGSFQSFEEQDDQILEEGTRWERFKARIRIKSRRHKQLAQDGIGHPFPRVRKFVLTSAFENTMAFLIVLNCFAIGWQAEQPIDPDPITQIVITVCEHFFTAAFVLELVLRILCFGWTVVLQAEWRLDVCLVCLSVLVTWVLGPLNLPGVQLLRKLTVLRTLRLVRIARAVRLRPEFKEMWALLKGLTDSGETLVWTYVMILCVLYFFAIMATSLIGKQKAFEDDPHAQEYFGNVLQSMLTLFQIMTLDSWTSVVRPLMEKQIWIIFFICLFISIAVFVLMNLITAVIVEHAFASAKNEEEEVAARMERQKEQELEELKLFFEEIDLDGSGMLTYQELFDAAKRKKVRQKLRALDIMVKDLRDIWDILDDGDGELSAEDFVNGIRRLRGEGKAKDVLRLYREVRVLETSVNEIGDYMDPMKEGSLARRMQEVQGQLSRARMDIVAVRRTMARAKEAVKLASKTQALIAPKDD